MISQPSSPVMPDTLEEFLRWEPVDGFKYEWNDGEVIRFERMKTKHLPIIRIFNRAFLSTSAFSNGGVLVMGQEVKLSNIQVRFPDLAYFGGSQIDESFSDSEPIPEFIIEIISPTDDALKVEEKLAEYFKSKVKVVWHIFPENEIVYVYTSRKHVQICTDSDICSASPVLPDFNISVNDLFTLPPRF